MSSSLSPPQTQKTLLVTGGAGFIGSHFVEKALASGYRVIVLDALNYAGNPGNLRQAKLKYPSRYKFIQGDLNDNRDGLVKLMQEEHIDAVINLAAQTHVGNSIVDPETFARDNVGGTTNMLQATLKYWQGLPPEKKDNFRYLQASTDEIFGQLGKDDPPFNENTHLNPRNPYSASKAGSDHMAFAFFHTYNLPVIITNSGNNYGPRQHTEKLISGTINEALKGKNYTIHGDGHNIRDWVYVEDTCNGLLLALEKGRAGERYCLGGQNELSNLQVIYKIGSVLQELSEKGIIPRRKDGKRYDDFGSLITFTEDRPGNDERYAVDISKARNELGYNPSHDFDIGLRKTVEYYVERYKEAQRGR